MPDFAGGGVGVFDFGAGEDREHGDFGCWWRHGDWTLSDWRMLNGIVDRKREREKGTSEQCRYICLAHTFSVVGSHDDGEPANRATQQIIIVPRPNNRLISETIIGAGHD